MLFTVRGVVKKKEEENVRGLLAYLLYPTRMLQPFTAHVVTHDARAARGPTQRPPRCYRIARAGRYGLVGATPCVQQGKR